MNEFEFVERKDKRLIFLFLKSIGKNGEVIAIGVELYDRKFRFLLSIERYVILHDETLTFYAKSLALNFFHLL